MTFSRGVARKCFGGGWAEAFMRSNAVRDALQVSFFFFFFCEHLMTSGKLICQPPIRPCFRRLSCKKAYNVDGAVHSLWPIGKPGPSLLLTC